MAYTSYEDLINDASHDPKLAKMRVAQAKREGSPVVSSSNSGYRDRAISKRLGGEKTTVNNRKVKYSSSTIKNKLNKSEENQADEIAAKRKRVGY